MQYFGSKVTHQGVQDRAGLGPNEINIFIGPVRVKKKILVRSSVWPKSALVLVHLCKFFTCKIATRDGERQNCNVSTVITVLNQIGGKIGSAQERWDHELSTTKNSSVITVKQSLVSHKNSLPKLLVHIVHIMYYVWISACRSMETRTFRSCFVVN